jgi:hypothetical protein
VRQGDGGDAQIHRAEAELGSLERDGSFGGGIIELNQPDPAIVGDPFTFPSIQAVLAIPIFDKLGASWC